MSRDKDGTYHELQALLGLKMNSGEGRRKDPRNWRSCLFCMRAKLRLPIDDLHLACFVCLYLEDLFQRKLPRER